MNSEGAIAVFDSGLGGLTVAAAIREALPSEHLVFLADRARVPYASLSPALITKFALECLEFLLEHQPKAVVIACNTVSAVAIEQIVARAGVPVLGVIESTADEAIRCTRNGRIGVLATSATIKRQAYDNALALRRADARVFSNGCPLLVPLVEEGWTDGEIPRKIVEHYAEPILHENIDTLILGCTHYEYFREHFQRVFGATVTLINTPNVTAARLISLLKQDNLLRSGDAASTKIYSSDVNDALVRVVDDLFVKRGDRHVEVCAAQIARIADPVRSTALMN